MAKGGNNQRSNNSRFSKPYDTSNSFVRKITSRVSDYLGGWFGTPSKEPGDSIDSESPPTAASRDTPITASHGRFEALDSIRESTSLSRRCFEDTEVADSPAKRMKIESKGKFGIDFPISPIPSTSSGLFHSNVNHNYEIQSNEDFVRSTAGPSGMQSQQYASTSNVVQSTTANTEVKANGAADDHSESSESTSGCSSLVPQSDRLSQSAYVCSSRKKNLEEKLNYARQLKQSRASLYLNRSIPVVSDSTVNRRKPSFDVSAYGTPIFDKSSVREKMVNSPFYTGQTSYGGASAYRRSKSSLYPQRNITDRKEGLQLQVKAAHHGSTEDLSNMSHTAKRILEALEQFSTPINDAKRIPVNSLNPPLGSKRRRFDDLSESRLKLSTPKTPLNPNAGPVIAGLNVPTVPDLLKLKRLERIQDSTAAARQVAVQKQEYALPPELPPAKHSGKMSSTKQKKKAPVIEKPEEVNLPKVALPITTLPKFDLKLPTPAAYNPPPPQPQQASKSPTLPKVKNFTFSPPIPVADPTNVKRSPQQRNNFTFSDPLNAEGKKDGTGKEAQPPLTEMMSSDAIGKLKRKSTSENTAKPSIFEAAKELKTGSVMDFLRTVDSCKKTGNKPFGDQFKPPSGTWECSECLIRNLNDKETCAACKSPKVSATVSVPRTTASAPILPSSDVNKSVSVKSTFGDKFLPPKGSWSCEACMVNNEPSATKCVACETPKSSVPDEKIQPAVEEKPRPPQSGFGDLFKKKAGTWECSVCMITNKENDTKCLACETPKPGAKEEKPEPPKFNFGLPPGGSAFKFGIDPEANATKASTSKTQPNGPQTVAVKPMQTPSVSTSIGVFTFGIPAATAQEKKEVINVEEVSSSKPEVAKPAATTTVESSKPSDQSITSTPATSEPEVVTRPDSSLWNNAPWAKELAKNDKKDNEASTIGKKAPESIFKATESECDSQKPSISFGSTPFKTPFAAIGTTAISTAVDPAPKPAATTIPKFTFGSTPSAVNSISSSSTGLMFGSVGSVRSVAPVVSESQAPIAVSTSSDTNVTKPSLFQMVAPKTTESAVSQTGSGLMFNLPSKKLEPVVKPAASDAMSQNTTVSSSTTSSFGSSLFNDSSKLQFGSGTKPAFGAKPGNSFFGNLGASTTTSSIFGSSVPTFNTSNFNGPSNQPVSANSFGTPITTAAETPAFGSNTIPAFGKPFGSATATTTAPAVASAFSNASTPSFGNPTPPSAGFGGFGSSNSFGSNSVSAFGSTSTPSLTPAPSPASTPATAPPSANSFASTPAFGAAFSTPANPPEKPFIFGASNNNHGNLAAPPTPASAPTPASTPGLFAFGSSKPEEKPPQFASSFGQNGQPQPFSFGSSAPAPANNVFGGFAPKTESSFGTLNAGFGTAGSFGQNSAPPAFGSTAPSFQFGSANPQPQATPEAFQFGGNRPQNQPASAPATAFSLSVPSSFNFTGGQVPTFSADPTSMPTTQHRRVIKAVRRSNR